MCRNPFIFIWEKVGWDFHRGHQTLQFDVRSARLFAGLF